MATQTLLFNIDDFDNASLQIDRDKAKLSRALRFLHAYFLKICEAEMPEDPLSEFHRTLHTEHDGRCILIYVISRGQRDYPDGFSIVMYKVGDPPSTIISSTKCISAAESLPPDQVGPCRSMFNRFVQALLVQLPPSERPQEKLEAIYESAKRGS